jgi:hypothetical protein
MRISKRSLNKGDIIQTEEVIEYVKEIHGLRDFDNGNLYNSLNKFDYYQVDYVTISDLNIDEYFKFEWLVDKYIDMYRSNKNYPPIVISNNYRIIDGNHRSNALFRFGLNKIKVIRGVLK